jgi:hypothetical protein
MGVKAVENSGKIEPRYEASSECEKLKSKLVSLNDLDIIERSDLPRRYTWSQRGDS